MKLKYYLNNVTIGLLVILGILILTMIGHASNDIYAVFGNEIIKPNEYKIILNENITSGVLVDQDNQSIFVYSLNYVYLINSTNGSIKNKLKISGIQEQKQTDDYLFLKSKNELYKIQKLNGTIVSKTIYNNNIGRLYTYTSFDYQTLQGLNGADGVQGLNGTIGYNGTNGINGTPVNYSLVYYKNETYNKLEINTSLELKLNKTDLNNSVDKNLSNYTNNPGFVTNATMTSDITKVNKTGNETITGNITFNNISRPVSVQMGNKLPGSVDYAGYIFYINYDNSNINYTVSTTRIVIDGSPNPANNRSNVGFLLRENGTNTWEVASYKATTDTSSTGTMTFFNKILNKQGWGMSAFTNNFSHNGNVSINSPYEFQIASLTGVGNRPLCANPSGTVVIC